MTQRASEFRELTSALQNCNPKIIGFDGWNGVGKTCLGKKLSRELGIRHIEIDRFVPDYQDKYVSLVNCDRLIDEIGNNPAIVDGIRLQEVAERCSFDIDYCIYVKRFSRTSWGELKWEHQEDTDAETDTLIAEQRTNLIVGINCYHKKYKPIDSADFCYYNVIE